MTTAVEAAAPLDPAEQSEDPWDRDQKGKLAEGYMVVDGVTLPGVLAREVEVEYKEDEKSEWPIRLTVHFYLDELEVDEDMQRFVQFTKHLTGPQVEVTE